MMGKTIADIAELAGVAKSTVSRYLNGGYVSDKTKEKIERIIRETGFEPNTFAQSLKAKKTNLIGVIIPRLDSYATSKSLIGIDETLKKFGYQMLISNTSQNIEREIESIYSFAKQKVSGIILIATEITQEHLEAMKKVKTPIIILGQETPEHHCIIHDDFNAAYDLGKFVVSMGYKDIAFLGVSERDIAVGVKRRNGFKKALEENEIEQVKYYVVGFDKQSSVKKAEEILKEHVPSIMVCATDNIALGAMKAIFEKKLNIPKDVSVTGFGGYDICDIVHPSLTTVKFDYLGAGVKAANNIIKLINGEEVSKLTVSGYEIIKNESIF
ncbi:LacI family DNA-binding transcriptional regulator [Clostridium thermopalmarium]